jgi:O-antigen/teichoic acid export membrane protein
LLINALELKTNLILRIRSIFIRLWNSPTVTNIFRVASANIFASVIGVIGTLIQARYIAPEELGYFRSFEIWTGYVFFLHLGIFGAFQRYYPYYIGKGKMQKANEVSRISLTWNILISFIVGGLFLVFAAVSLFHNNWKASLAWVVQAIIIWGYFYGGHLSILFNSTHNFKSLSKSTFLSTFITSLTLPIFLIWPYIAMVLRSGLGSAVRMIYMHILSQRFSRIKFAFKPMAWFKLAKDGFPMFTASYMSGIGWETLEKTIVFYYIGTHGLGLWSISIMLLTMAKLVPQSVTAIYIPRIIEGYGKTHDTKYVLRLCIRPMLITTPLIILLYFSLIITLPSLIPIIMPKYVEAIPIIGIMLLNLVIEIFILPYSLLIVMGKILQQNLASIIGLISFFLLGLFSIQYGYGLLGIIIASFIGKLVRLILVYTYILSAKTTKYS